MRAVAAGVLLGVLAAGCNGGGGGTGGAGGGKAHLAGMVTDKGGIGDLSFNWMGWEGLQRAQRELGLEVAKIESHEDADYQPNLQRLAERGARVVFAVGYALEPAVATVAPRYPDTHFVIIDSAEPKLPNVTGVTFREEEGAFLAGALAGGMSKSGRLGFVGGMEIPLIKRFEAGYSAGARTIRPDVRVGAKYTNTWEDVALGKELALALFSEGADVVMHASGRCGLGVIEAARERGPGFWAIGVDADQDYLGTADPENPAPPSRVLTSMLKRVDNVVFALCEEARAGSLRAGVREFGVSNDGVGISPLRFTKDEIPPALLARVEALRARIAAGEVKPPRTLAALAAWPAPP